MLLIKLVLLPLGMIYAAVVASAFLMQRQLQYFPDRSLVTPAETGLVGVAAESLTTPDGETLILWHAPARAGRPTILFFHGNAGSLADRAQRLAFWQARGFGVAFLSYRGFGGSTGTPSEAGLLADARTAHDFLLAQGVAPTSIVAMGESLGTGVAVRLAAERPLGALILEAPFTSATDVAARAYPFLPVRLLLKDRFASLEHIGAVTAPLLVLHGTADEVIPLAFGQRLFDAANQPKTFRAIEGANHAALFDPAIWALEADFLATLFPP